MNKATNVNKRKLSVCCEGITMLETDMIQGRSERKPDVNVEYLGKSGAGRAFFERRQDT